MPLKRISPSQIDFHGSLTPHQVEAIVTDPALRVLQASSPVDSDTWDLLNSALFAKRDDITLRVYGFYSSNCDLSFLTRLSNVQRFSADCLTRATHVESVACLPNLKSLSIGIYDLESFDFLDDMQAVGITDLFLSATKSKKPRLSALARFPQLRRLYLEGQQKDLEIISRLTALEDLTLRSITVANLDFLRGLDHLLSLDIKLGGTNNLEALADVTELKYLELWQIRGMRDIAVVSKLLGLQFLFLQSLPQVTAIPDLSRLTSLRRVYMENMKGLQDISNLAGGPALEELIHVSAQGMEPGHYAHLLKSKSLKRMLVGFGSLQKNEALRNLAAKAGIEEYHPSEFSFA